MRRRSQGIAQSRFAGTILSGALATVEAQFPDEFDELFELAAVGATRWEEAVALTAGPVFSSGPSRRSAT